MLSSTPCRIFASSLVAATLFFGSPAFAGAPPASDDPFAEHTESAGRGEIGLSGSGGYARSKEDSGGPSYDGTTYASGEAYGRYYFRPLREMRGPRSSLPFLQRASSIGISGSFGGSWMDPALTGRSITSVGGGVGVNGLAYVVPQFVLGGAITYSQSSLTDRVTARHFVSPSVFVGLRTGDNLLSLGFRHTIAVVGGELQPTRFGSLSLSDTILVDGQVALNGFVSLRDRGLEAGGSGALYPIDDLALYAGGSAGRAAFDSVEKVVYNSYRAFGGIAGWLTHFVQLGATYDFGVTVDPAIQTSRTSHTGTLFMVARIP